MNDKLGPGPEGLLLMLGLGVLMTIGLGGGHSPLAGFSRKDNVEAAAAEEDSGSDTEYQEADAGDQLKPLDSQRPRVENEHPESVKSDPTRILQPITQLNRRIQDISQVIEEVTSSMSNIIEATDRLRNGSI